VQELESDGYTCVEIRQGVQTLSDPTKYFRELVLKGLIVHDGSPLLTWCLSNAIEVQDNNANIKLSKKHKDDSQRIDLAAAIINAMVRAMLNEDTTSVYEERGIRTL
jgi:phage terminase large subunit-like protein